VASARFAAVFGTLFAAVAAAGSLTLNLPATPTIVVDNRAFEGAGEGTSEAVLASVSVGLTYHLDAHEVLIFELEPLPPAVLRLELRLAGHHLCLTPGQAFVEFTFAGGGGLSSFAECDAERIVVPDETLILCEGVACGSPIRFVYRPSVAGVAEDAVIAIASFTATYALTVAVSAGPAFVETVRASYAVGAR
jgi:hypothetical protein